MTWCLGWFLQDIFRNQDAPGALQWTPRPFERKNFPQLSRFNHGKNIGKLQRHFIEHLLTSPSKRFEQLSINNHYFFRSAIFKSMWFVRAIFKSICFWGHPTHKPHPMSSVTTRWLGCGITPCMVRSTGVLIPWSEGVWWKCVDCHSCDPTPCHGVGLVGAYHLCHGGPEWFLRCRTRMMYGYIIVTVYPKNEKYKSFL